MIDATDERLHARLLGRRHRDILTARDRRAFAGTRVLVTGGGGSVGSGLALEIARCRPMSLTIVDQSEDHLLSIERALVERQPDVDVDVVLGDVSRQRTIELTFRRARPEVVFHAAACGHVTLCERAVCRAVRTNVFGTLYTARAAADCGARFTLVSSDQAAQAHGVMGATRRLAELVVLARFSGLFRPVVVRLGSVLGSRGSLLEAVADRLRRGLPAQVAHPEATRDFMTPREAVGLVMKTTLIGEGGVIYWLDAGKPVSVLTLVRRALQIAVQQGARPLPVEFTGLKAGERLRVEDPGQGLEACRTRHPGIREARQPLFDGHVVRRVLQALREDLRRDDAGSALMDLQAAVPGFEPSDATWQYAFAQSVGVLPSRMTRRAASVA